MYSSYRAGPDIRQRLFIGVLTWGASDGTSWIFPAGIAALVNGTVSTNAVPTDLQFKTAASGAGTERMRITSGGFVGIGTTAPAYRLDVAGSANVSSQYFIGGTNAINVPTFTSLSVGNNALAGYTASSETIAVGYQALNSIIYGGGSGSNTALGAYAATSNNTGAENTAIGRSAMYGNDSGQQNTSLGAFALFSMRGSYNVGLGDRAGQNIGSGSSSNTIIGYNAASNATAGSGNIAIGASTTLPTSTGSNQLSIGNTIYGDMTNGLIGINNFTPAAALDIVGSATTNSALIVPRATIAQRPSTPVNGMIRYQIDGNVFEVYANGTWVNLGSGGGGSGSSQWTTNGTAIYYSSGNVAIGTTTAPYKLTLAKDGGIFAAGTYGSGAAIGTVGATTALLWNPNTAAFRVGGTSSNAWDTANVGGYFFSEGLDSIASGGHSVSMGLSNIASNTGAIAIGYFSNATNQYSVALGGANQSTGTGSVAAGYFTTASGIGAFAGGNGTRAPAFGETAVGAFNAISGSETGGTWTAADPIFVVGNGTSSSAYSNALSVLHNGNVGIGTSAPAKKLDVQETRTDTSTINVSTENVYQAVNPASASTASFFGESTVADFTSSTASTSATLAGIQAVGKNSSTAAVGTLIGVSGIGQVNNSGNTTNVYGAQVFGQNNSTGTVNSGIGVQGFYANNGGTTLVAHGGEFFVAQNAGTITSGAGVYIGNIGATNKWSLYASDATSPSYFAGSVGVGTTAPSAPFHIHEPWTANFPLKLSTAAYPGTGWVVGPYSTGNNFYIIDEGNQGMYLTKNNGAAGWNANSDMRLKEDIVPLNISEGLEAILKLRPVNYKWRDRRASSQTQIGFIAQEVQNVLPNLVTVGKDNDVVLKDGSVETVKATLGVNYTGFIVPLVSAVQEQQQLIQGLKDENASLKARLDSQAAELQMIKEKLGLGRSRTR